MRFPAVQGINLLRTQVQLPEELDGELNVVLVAFQQWQQAMVDSWIPFLEELERRFPYLRYYELPTIQRLDPLSRFFINEGMRAGIPHAETRAKTVTLYVDKKAFRQALEMADENTIYVFLLDRSGNVLWRTEGAHVAGKGEYLAKVLDQLHGSLSRDPNARTGADAA